MNISTEQWTSLNVHNLTRHTFRSLSSKDAMSVCPYLIAVTSALIPRLVLSMSQPARHKCLTRLMKPCLAATCSGVKPFLLGVSRSIPFSIKKVTIPSSPVSQAMCKSVSSFYLEKHDRVYPISFYVM